jgi:hypothetical protein
VERAAKVVEHIDAVAQHIDMTAQHVDAVLFHIDRMTRHLGEISPTSSAASPLPDWWHGFLAQMHAPDWVQAALLAVAAGALISGVWTLREQARGRDFENYLALMEKITLAWRGLSAAATDEDRYFEFTELINLLEATCHMFNKRVIRGTSRDMICNYLRDMLPQIFADTTAAVWITKSQTTKETYQQIREFARRQKLEGVPHITHRAEMVRARAD